MAYDIAIYHYLYGDNISNESYVNIFYISVLGRDYDQEGYNFWLINLNNGIKEDMNYYWVSESLETLETHPFFLR